MKIDRRGTVSILNETFAGYRRFIAVLASLAFLSALLDGVSIVLLVPLLSFLTGTVSGPIGLVGSIIEKGFIFTGIPFQFRYMLTVIALLIILRTVIMGLFFTVRAKVNARFFAEEMARHYKLTMEANWSFISRERVGYLQNTILWDTKRTGQLLDTIVQFVQSGTGFFIYLAVAISISPIVTLITIVAGAVLLFTLRPLIRRSRSFGEDMSRIEKDLAQHVSEHVQGFKTVKSAGVNRLVLTRAYQQFEAFRSVYSKAVLIQSISSIFIQPFSFIFAMLVFVFMYYSGTFNIAAFAAIIYLIQKIFVYLDSTQSALSGVVQFIPFAENLIIFRSRALAAQEVDADTHQAFSFSKEITFKDVSLKYGDDTEALAGVSFSVAKGSTLGIVGPSGGGKTSIADLLLRLFQPTSGDILIDGMDISTVRMSDWRREIGYVSQDAFLMHVSIRDNIRFYDASVTDEDIEHAAKQAHVYNDILRLPEGFDTVLGDRGATLSGGQRQRIALARVLARKPDVLVLDEVTSSLDSELEAEIQKVISELRGSVTLVIIAHRVSTVLNADSIVVVQKGRVVEQGDPRVMLKNQDSYISRIAQMQGSGAQRDLS